MIRVAVIAALLSLGAGPALAQNDFQEDRLELLLQLVCDNGGTMTDAIADEILPTNNFTMPEVREIVFELEDRGLVNDVGTGTLILNPDACAG